MRRAKAAPRKRLQELTGRLQHASFGIPGGQGLFSPFDQALAGNKPFITITTDLQVALTDWIQLIRQMKSTPTHVCQLTPDYPSYIGYSDSCKAGTGGIWTSGTKGIKPIVWHLPFPEEVQKLLCTEHNPNGSITMNTSGCL